MTVEIAFCNDCDLMTWRGYREIHDFFDSLDIPARDSFWLFDPSGSDMALFTHDTNHKGPRHNELLEGISSGRFDVLHSAGSYGARFNAGYKPTRKLVAQALEYLAKHARVPNIWSNHGDVYNIQNIGGAFPSDHHNGDIPESEIYIIDLLIEHGIKYFWLDRLLVTDDGLPCRIVAEERCRSGHTIKTFSRFNGVDWAPNGQNLHQQITPERLARLIELKQNIILYQHWGCHHMPDRTAYTPTGDALVKESRDALLRLADIHHKGELKVTHLYDLLEKEDRKPLADEAQRIGAYVVRLDKEKEDVFYYNQYNKYSTDYFQRRIRQLGLTGESALDAGCGVGQWAFAMTGIFRDIIGIDFNETAYKYLTDITTRLRQNSPSFDKGSIESLPYPDERFDALISYSVLFCADGEKVVNEFSRVLKPGGEAYIGLNADGWYEYLHDERFAGSPEEKRITYAVPLWNATYRRMGGKETFKTALFSPSVSVLLDGGKLDHESARKLIKLVTPPDYPKEYADIMEHYSNDVKKSLGNLLKEYLLLLEEEEEGSVKAKAIDTAPAPSLLSTITLRLKKLFAPSPNKPDPSRDNLFIKTNLTTLPPPKNNSPFMPFELERLAVSAGFDRFSWAADGKLNRIGGESLADPIYNPDFRGQVGVWECLLRKKPENA